jgi:hypothetical protein
MRTRTRGREAGCRNVGMSPRRAALRVVALGIVVVAVGACGLVELPTPPSGNTAVPTEAPSAVTGGVSFPPEVSPSDNAFGEPPAEAAAQAQISVDNPYFEPSVNRAALDADLLAIADAFATKDPAAVASWLHPDVRERLNEVFTANAAKLDAIAALLATRRPVFVGAEYAEYEVTDASGTFTVMYQRSGDHWMLVGL